MTQAVATKPGAVAPATACFRPTVLIGLGGVGCRVVQSLRRRLEQRFAEPVEVSSLKFLALDTDRAALRALEGAENAGGLAPDETLPLPLRKSADYRSASDEILAWLGRRWLYNIPRSLRTEGLRPLGRLAFVGHRQIIAERIAAALTGVAGDAARRTGATKEHPGQTGCPRVFVITSIGGGTGGGMLLDVAYTVRQQLNELGLSTDGVWGMLLHATFGASSGNDLRTANAYATLTELNHFMHGKAAYHAGPLEILPAGDLAEPPFAGTYLVHLGDEIGQADFDQGIDRIVEYLYLDAATACGAVMDRWRNAGSAKGSGPRETGVPVRLRSFGLHARRFSKFLVAARQADQLCLRLVRRWLGEQEDRQNAPNAVQPPEFQLADLVARLTAIADKALGGSAETHFRALLAAGPGGPSVVRDDDPVGPFGDDLRRIHAVLGVPASAEVPPPAQPPPLECELREGAEKLAATLARSLVDSIRELVERPQARLPAATTAVSLAQGHLRDVRRAAEEAYRHDHDEAAALWWKLQRGELPRGTAWFGRFSSAAKDPEDLLLDYCRLRLRAMIHKFVASMSQQAATEVASLGDRLGKLRQSVQSLADQFASGLASREQSTPAWLSSSERDLAEELAPLAERGSVEQFDETLQREWLEPRGGLLGLAEETSENLLILKRELRQRGCDRVMKVLDRVDAWYLLAKATSTAEKLSAAIQDGAEQAGIRLRGASGAEKLLVLMPQGAKGKLLVDALKHTWPDGFVVPSEEGDLVFCREVEGISLSEAANALVKGRNECAAAARHVLTRVDISWAALATE